MNNPVRKHLCTLMVFLGIAGVLRAEPAKNDAPALPPGKVSKQTLAPAWKKVIDVSLKGMVVEHLTGPTIFIQKQPKDILSLFQLFYRAKEDQAVDSILLRLGPLAVGWGKCQELRAMIEEFRLSGKKVRVWLPFATNKEFYVASAADEILMPPAGLLLIKGLRAEVTFMKGLLEKIGVEAEIVHVGTHKGAGEPYMRTEMSPALRESVEAIIDDTFEAYVQGVSKGRGLKSEQFRATLSRGPFRAKSAKEEKLIDQVVYLEDYLKELKAKGKVKLVKECRYSGDGSGRPDFGSLPGLLDFLSQISTPPSMLKSPHPKIAFIYAVGPIMADAGGGIFPGGGNVVTAPPLVKAFKEAREDKTVKTIVFRVDSPGGDVITSDLIWKAVEDTNKVKPVIVSMSDVAASGGYYISMPARAIVAHRTTITGSIGVLAGKFNLKKLYELIGINVEVVERGPFSGLFSTEHKLTEEERDRLYQLMKQTYDLFLEKAAAGRNKKVEELAKAAEGRAWTARRAVELGLVDELGGIRTAVNLAKKHAGLKVEEKLELLVLPRPKSLFDLFGSGLFDESRLVNPLLRLPLRLQASQLRELNMIQLLAERLTLFYLPWTIQIK